MTEQELKKRLRELVDELDFPATPKPTEPEWELMISHDGLGKVCFRGDERTYWLSMSTAAMMANAANSFKAMKELCNFLACGWRMWSPEETARKATEALRLATFWDDNGRPKDE